MTQRVSFRWNCTRLEGRLGDSVAAALYRAGIRSIACTRKRHLPLGYSGSFIGGVLGRVSGRPNVRLDLEPAADGLEVSAQNTWPLPGLDLLKLGRLVPEAWVRGGFEHPRAAPGGSRRFQVWERLLWTLAGVADPPRMGLETSPVPGRVIDVDVLVVGGGPAGRQAANEAARAGKTVGLASRSRCPGSFARVMGEHLPDLDAGVELITGIEIFGTYRGGTLVAGAPHDHAQGAVAFNTRQLVLATGQRSLPPLVPGAHLPGVMDAHAALHLAHGHGVRLGQAVAVVGTGAEAAVAARLQASGTMIAYCGTVRSLRSVEGRSGVTAVRTDRRIACDVLVHCGPWASDPGLVSQASGDGLLHLQVGPRPPNVMVAGAAARPDEPPYLGPERIREALVCPCMDVTAGELIDQIAKGETDPEVLKRSTSCGMGPCQGVPCWSTMAALIESGAAEQREKRRPSSRGPRRAITVAQAAGLDGLVEPDR